MPDFRCYSESIPETAGSSIELSPEESNHLVAANRARVGDPVRVFNGKGLEAETTLIIANKRKATLEISKIHRISTPAFRIVLAQAIPKGKTFEGIIKKATEIGIQEIVPLVTSRVESRLTAQKRDSKHSKWTASSLEGAKQSGNPFPVKIAETQTLAGLAELSRTFDLKLIASLESGARSLKAHLAEATQRNAGKAPESVLWLIGPEGDFTPQEYALAGKLGFRATSLGTHVMRSETAAIHAISITYYELAGSSDTP